MGAPPAKPEPPAIATPPVAEGMVRLYRGEGGEGGSNALSAGDKSGLNFTDDRAKAEKYRGKDGRLAYVDVPQSYVDDYRTGTDQPNTNVFMLSKEDTASAQPFV